MLRTVALKKAYGPVAALEGVDRRLCGSSPRRRLLARNDDQANLAAGLAGESKVVILDEPASSLDPAGRVDVLQLLATLAPTTTVLLSSHELPEIEVTPANVGYKPTRPLASRHRGS